MARLRRVKVGARVDVKVRAKVRAKADARVDGGGVEMVGVADVIAEIAVESGVVVESAAQTVVVIAARIVVVIAVDAIGAGCRARGPVDGIVADGRCRRRTCRRSAIC